MRGAFQVADFTMMIRATRGRSSRPNHMQSQFRSPDIATPVDFRRLAGGLHSVAKQAPSKTPFFCVPGRFWCDFKRFGEAKKEVKIDFGEVFF